MHLEMAHPWVLMLLPLCIAILIGQCVWDRHKYGSRRGSAGKRKAGELVLRSMIILLVILSIADVSIQKKSDITTTVFLVDMSDSTKGIQEQEVAFVKDAIAELPNKNQTGIVVFGGDAQIEQFVTDKKTFTEVQAQVRTSATNLSQAVQTAMALFPDDSAKRLVLLTDGAENEGDLAEVAASYAAAEIELKVVKYDSTLAEEVYVDGVSLPERIAEGDQFQVEVEVVATEPTDAVVSLYSGRTLKGRKEVSLQKGSNSLVFSDTGVENGLKSYRVMVEAEQDTVSINNSYSAFTQVEAAPRLLIVEGDSGESASFVSIVEACNFDYEVVSPSGVPGNIADMIRYQSVVLVDVYADDLREGFLDTLQTYVKDYAGGLVVLGGENSYALGNYRDTPLEEVLPVRMDLEGEKQIPKIAMTMVIDHSGSMMSASTLQGGISCMEVAKQAAINALDSLREIDEVGVVAFDDKYTWAVPRQTAGNPEEIISAIAGIEVGGGTSIYPAVDAAIEDMKESDASLKHIVLLTDGQDGYHNYDKLIEKLKENQITLSTVAIGAEADGAMLEWLAQEGQGRYYYSDAGTALPRIFAQEVYLSTQSYLIQEEFTPILSNSHEIVNGIFAEGSPSLFGYIAATPKETATVLLESHRQDPVLAVWQYGLGHTVAWTSDGSGEWTGNFASWEGYPALWRRILDWTISDTSMGDDTVSVEQTGDEAILSYETEEYDANTGITAMITDENGQQQEVHLNATAPGVYQASVPLTDEGVYSVNIRNQSGEEVVKNINTAAAVQYSREYRYSDSDGALDHFVTQTGGTVIESVSQVFDTTLEGARSRKNLTTLFLVLSILLFGVDVAVRRLSIDWLSQFGQAAGWVSARATGLWYVRRKDRSASKQKKPVRVGEEKENNEETYHSYSQPVTEDNIMEREKSKPEKGKNFKQKSGKKSKENTNTAIDTAALLRKKNERKL